MSKNAVIIGVVILIAIGFIFVLFSGGNSSIDTSSTENLGGSGADPLQEPVGSIDEGARYVVYSEGVIEKAKGKRRVLYFYANWCPTCKVANEDFSENSSRIPEDVVVIRVNYNDSDTDRDEKDLAQKYGITYQHTFVQIDDEGKEIAKWIGGQIDLLLTQIK
jgi:thioredoxin 1